MFKIRRKLNGYMLCQMCGGRIYRFINICRKNKIYLWNIDFSEKKDDSYEESPNKKQKLCVRFFMLAQDYDDADKISKQCGGSLIILGKYGLPFFILKNKRRAGIVAGLLLGTIAIYIMSLYIWNIELSGNAYYTDENVISYLEEIGAGCGTKKKAITPSELEEEIRIQFPFISWVSAQMIGTKLMINIEEGTINESKDIMENGNICAMEDGIIISIMTRKGTPMVHAGDEVKKGDLLILSTVDIIGDDASVVETVNTGADGDIFLEIRYPVEKKFMKNYQMKQYTQNEQTKWRVQLFGYDFFIGDQKSEDYSYYDSMIYLKKLRLTENFYLPFEIEKTVQQEYVLNKASYTDAQIEEMMKLYVNTVIENITAMEGEIIENHVKTEVKSNFGLVSGYFVAKVKNNGMNE